MYERYIKRILDVIGSAIGIVAFAPFFLIVAILIKLDSKGPVLFKQKRVGKDKTYFMIWKFRSMRIDTPSEVPTNELASATGYTTRMGRILRATSFDEMPQLFNILVGDMSFIGPRPALWNQYELIAMRDKYGANAVRPGLSGWAQVNGRDSLPEEKKSLRDGEYAHNISFRFDVKCLLLTIVKVFNREGIAEGKEGKHYSIRHTEEDQ